MGQEDPCPEAVRRRPWAEDSVIRLKTVRLNLFLGFLSFDLSRKPDGLWDRISAQGGFQDRGLGGFCASSVPRHVSGITDSSAEVEGCRDRHFRFLFRPKGVGTAARG